MQEELKPRLFTIKFPLSLWKQLTRINVTTNSGRQRLKRLREKHRPFLNFTEDVALRQIAAGDDFVVELPLRYDARFQPPIRRLEELDEVHGTVGGRPGKTWWLTTSPEIAFELGKRDSTCSASAILRGFRCLVLRKDRERLRLLRVSLDSRVRGMGVRAQEEMVELLRWLEMRPELRERTVSVRPRRGAEEQCVTAKAAEAYAIIEEGHTVPQDGIEFDVPPKYAGI